MVSGNHQGGIHVHRGGMPRPMGISKETEGGFHLACGSQIIGFKNILEPHETANQIFNSCYTPRVSYYTGPLDAHDIATLKDGTVVFVNTKFNCIATLDEKQSFKEYWRPNFIDALVNEDRCHLNGLAVHDGECRYVTAVSRSNTIDGWRDRRNNGGIIIDVKTGEIVCRGLSMPHSPRMHQGKLWVLNSGTGELGYIKGLEEGEGTFEPVMFCPGFVRGLDFIDNYAVLGLSKPRYERFEGLDLDKKLEEADSEPWCGIQIVDINKKTCAEWFRVDGSLSEIYDVALLKNSGCSMSVGLNTPELYNLLRHEVLVDPPKADENTDIPAPSEEVNK